MIEWILSDELKEFIKTELLKGVEKYKENPNAEHEYLKCRGIIQPQRRENKMNLSNVEVCPYCNSQNIITEYDWVHDVYIILCGNCGKKREVKGDKE